MDINSALNHIAATYNLPKSFLLIGPLCIAIALHILRGADAKRPVETDGRWKGMTAEKKSNGVIASICALIFIVVVSYFAFNTFTSVNIAQEIPVSSFGLRH